MCISGTLYENMFTLEDAMVSCYLILAAHLDDIIPPQDDIQMAGELTNTGI